MLFWRYGPIPAAGARPLLWQSSTPDGLAKLPTIVSSPDVLRPRLKKAWRLARYFAPRIHGRLVRYMKLTVFRVLLLIELPIVLAEALISDLAGGAFSRHGWLSCYLAWGWFRYFWTHGRRALHVSCQSDQLWYLAPILARRRAFG